VVSYQQVNCFKVSCSCREAGGSPSILHRRVGLFGLVRGGSVAAVPEEKRRGSGAASPSHMLPGQDPKVTPSQGDATPAPPHPEGGGKQRRAIPNTQGYGHRSRTEAEVFIALLH